MSKGSDKSNQSELERLETIKKFVIIAMFSDDGLMDQLVLKGGNALDIIHGISKRASADVDFSMADDIPETERATFRDTIERVLVETFRPEGLEVFDVKMAARPIGLTPDMAGFWGGYQIEFKLIEKQKFDKFSASLDDLRRNAIPFGQGTKFLIDISKFEYTEGKEAQYLEGFRIFVYSPEMMVAEKLRAICQQMKEYAPVIKRTRDSTARARDFVDIHTLVEHCKLKMSSPKNSELISHVFSAKRVPLELLAKIPDYREFHEHDFEAVKQSAKPGVKLEEFGFYFDYVTALARNILAEKRIA